MIESSDLLVFAANSTRFNSWLWRHSCASSCVWNYLRWAHSWLMKTFSHFSFHSLPLDLSDSIVEVISTNSFSYISWHACQSRFISSERWEHSMATWRQSSENPKSKILRRSCAAFADDSPQFEESEHLWESPTSLQIFTWGHWWEMKLWPLRDPVVQQSYVISLTRMIFREDCWVPASRVKSWGAMWLFNWTFTGDRLILTDSGELQKGRWLILRTSTEDANQQEIESFGESIWRQKGSCGIGVRRVREKADIVSGVLISKKRYTHDYR